MYEKFYNLEGAPFSLLPDSDFLFMGRRHRRAVNMFIYGIMIRAGFMVITGDVGAGKTTVVRRYVKSAGPDVKLGIISNPMPGTGHLLDWVCLAFDLGVPAGQNLAQTYHDFVAFLVDLYASGRRAVLVIDEAQNLDEARLEELRMLSNVNNEKDSLLQIVLVGQPELLERLKRSELRQFIQRVAVHCHLGPLTAAETAAYIRHRLSVVGGAPRIFSDAACATVHFFSGGVPRLINLLCDQAMVYGFSEDRKEITPELVAEVVRDRVDAGLSPFSPLPPGSFNERLPDIARIFEEIQKSNLT